MKRIVWITLFSLMANVLLAAWWLKERPAGETRPPVVRLAVDTTNASAMEPGTGVKSTNPALPIVEQGQGMTWKDVQSDDLKEFVRKLRAAGCPEETVRDMIMAEVNRIYNAKMRALWPERDQNEPYWKIRKQDPGEAKKYRERRRQQKALQEEKSALLVELLGVDPEKEQSKVDGTDTYQNWHDSRFSYLPESKREAVSKYLEDFQDKMQEFYQNANGMWDSETRAEQKKLEQEQLQGLSQWLTPEEVREYELRDSQLAQQLRHDLQAFSSLTQDQYESIYDIRKKYGDSIYNYADENTKDSQKLAEESKKAMQEDISTALGPDMAKTYQRSQDWSYQQLSRLAKRNDLPEGTADKVYDYKDTAEQSVKQLQQDNTLTPDQRQAALQQIRTETENTLKSTLGEKSYNRYLNNGGGWWINTVGPRPPSRNAP